MLTEKDIALHKGLMKLLNEASFVLKAREVIAFSDIYAWTNSIPKRLAEKPVVKKKVTKNKVVNK